MVGDGIPKVWSRYDQVLPFYDARNWLEKFSADVSPPIHVCPMFEGSTPPMDPSPYRCQLHGSIHGLMHGSMHRSVHGSIHASIHGSMHASMHGSIHGSMHGCMHGSLHASMHASLHASMHPCMHPCMHPDMIWSCFRHDLVMFQT